LWKLYENLWLNRRKYTISNLQINIQHNSNKLTLESSTIQVHKRIFLAIRLCICSTNPKSDVDFCHQNFRYKNRTLEKETESMCTLTDIKLLLTQLHPQSTKFQLHLSQQWIVDNLEVLEQILGPIIKSKQISNNSIRIVCDLESIVLKKGLTYRTL
jgi:hypothetical protein